MADFDKKVDFEKIVYTYDFDNQEIVNHVLGDLCRNCAEITTAPDGVGPKFHLRGNELWTWGHQGQFPRCFETYDTKEEAEYELMLTFKYDLDHQEEFCYFDSVEELEDYLRELED